LLTNYFNKHPTIDFMKLKIPIIINKIGIENIQNLLNPTNQLEDGTDISRKNFDEKKWYIFIYNFINYKYVK